MAKVTAVIDIGSNSVRMAVFKKTSALGFYLLEEAKARVRISEDSYKNNANLCQAAIERTSLAIGDFLQIAKFYKARKILCVATSAVRDAPNKQEFISLVKKQHKLNIKTISGEKEAFFGGLAAINLVGVKNGVTVDIGGGSCELALIQNKKITQKISLDLGTVRIKEMFFDKGDIKGAKNYIGDIIKNLSSEFKNQVLIGIGGTIRSLSGVIMKKNNYPLDILHGFSYAPKDELDFISSVVKADKKTLQSMGFKDERLDVVKQGCLIFKIILEILSPSLVITSGVGVREGVFLADLLRNSAFIFPANFNPSVKMITDRFDVEQSQTSHLSKLALEIYALINPANKDLYNMHMVTAIKLASAGQKLSFYKRSKESFDLALFGLSYGFSHKDRLLIAFILDNQQKKDLENLSIPKEYEQFLPPRTELFYLCFAFFVAKMLNKNKSLSKFEFAFADNTLTISTKNDAYLTKEYIKANKKIGKISLVFN